MLLKVPFIWIGYLLIDRFVSFAFAGTNTIQLDTSDEPCTVTASKERTISNNTVVFYLGDDIHLKFISQHYMNRIICNVSHPSNIFDFTVMEIDPKLYRDEREKKLEHMVIENVTKTYDGNWSCEILTLKDNLDVSNIVTVDNSTYRQTFCRARVHIQTRTNTIQLDTSHEPCTVAASRERTISNNTVVFYLGDDIHLEFISQHYMNRIICNVSHPSNSFDFTVKKNDLKLYRDEHEKKLEHMVIENVTKTYDGNWSCEILTLKDNLDVSNIVTVDNSTYRQTFCRARVHIQTPSLKAEWMWVALGGGVLMLLIVITATVRAFRKGKREEAMVQRASVNNESFTNEPQEPTPPFPQGPKLEQTYLAPIDLQESPYATSRPENDTYALPYTPSNVEELYSKPTPKRSRINELYTKVLPKSLRKQQESSKYVNSAELTYAEISHTGPSKKPVAHKQIQKEDNYAAVVHNN